jgi:hypothetical protein
LFSDKYVAQRVEKAEKLRENGLNPYDNKIDEEMRYLPIQRLNEFI